tara:strand:- start:204 stop:2195 length:1992 start_codon:yes stop_codon:yes gene_type:complete
MPNQAQQDILDEVVRSEAARNSASGSPVAINAAQQQLIEQVTQKRGGLPTATAPAALPEDPAAMNLGRTALQGATFGSGDEIEAAIRSMLPEGMGGGEYKEIRNKVREELSRYKQQNPGTAITTELVGAIVPSILATMMTGGTAAPLTVGRMAGIGFAEGAASGLGYSESEDFGGQLADTLQGGGIGTFLNPVVGKGGKFAIQGVSKLIDFTKRKLGKLPADAVQAEIQRLIKLTGKNEQQLMMDFMEGRYLSDNKTLQNALKAYVIEGGEAGAEVLSRSAARAKTTKQGAIDALQERFAPGMEDNVLRGFSRSEEALQKEQSKMYDKIFKNAPDDVITESIRKSMTDAAQTVPGALDTVNTLYAMNNLVPLFSKDAAGAIKMVRKPTLRDAEMIRRGLSEAQNKFYIEGQGSLGEAVKRKEQSLRTGIDEASKPLARVRADYAKRLSANESFAEGRKALRADVAETEMYLENLTGEQLKAFKAGVMVSLRNQINRQKTTFAKLADEDAQFGATLRMVLDGGDENIDDLIKKLDLAGDTSEIAQKVKPGAGSPTAQLERELKNQGLDISAADFLDPTMGFMRAGIKALKQNAPELNDAERLQVIRTIFTQEPKVAFKALSDEKMMDALVKKYSRVGRGAGVYAGTAATSQATQPEGLLNIMTP